MPNATAHKLTVVPDVLDLVVHQTVVVVRQMQIHIVDGRPTLLLFLEHEKTLKEGQVDVLEKDTILDHQRHFGPVCNSLWLYIIDSLET